MLLTAAHPTGASQVGIDAQATSRHYRIYNGGCGWGLGATIGGLGLPLGMKGMQKAGAGRKGRQRDLGRAASPTFQLFIYESLSTWYHYPVKRTRDVGRKVNKSNANSFSFYYYNNTPSEKIKRASLKVFKFCLSDRQTVNSPAIFNLKSQGC